MPGPALVRLFRKGWSAGKALVPTGAPVMIGLVSIPVLVLAGLLLGAWQRHELQYADARDVVEVYREGLAALPEFDRMRALGRAAFSLSPQLDATSAYEDAARRGQADLAIFLARVGERAAKVPTLRAPLDRLAQMPPLREIVVEFDADTQGPLPAIGRYADGVHRLLSAVLYGADLPERGNAQATELLLLVPDTLRRLRLELSQLQMFVLPSESTQGASSSDDIKELDRSWNELAELADLLESQLRDIEQRQGPLPHGKDTSRIDDVRAYVDLVDQRFILDDRGIGWAEARQAGLRAESALTDIESGLLEKASARLAVAGTAQRRADLLMASGLFLLYGVIVYFMLQYYRSRAAQLRERELQREVEERRQRERELMQLNALSEALMACQSPTEACDVFASAATKLLPDARGALALVSAEPDRLLVVSRWGGESSLPTGIGLGDCRAVRERRLCRFTGGEEGCAHDAGVPPVPHVCIPLVVEGQVLGLLWIECVGEDAEGRIQLAVSASESLKLTITNIRLRETLHEQAIRDTLTGLYNRRHLQDVFNREISHARRSGQPISLVVLDIDHFKQVNDRYGHDAGDRALVSLARHLHDNLRASDFSFRLGGEEFVLLLRADLLGGRKCAENLLTTFREKLFRYHETAPVQLTFSAGVVEAPLFGQDFDTLFKLADEALYRAKTGGRNRVELAVPAPLADALPVVPEKE